MVMRLSEITGVDCIMLNESSINSGIIIVDSVTIVSPYPTAETC